MHLQFSLLKSEIKFCGFRITWTQNTHIFKQVKLLPWHMGQGVEDLTFIAGCTWLGMQWLYQWSEQFLCTKHWQVGPLLSKTIYPLLQEAVPTTITESVINQSLIWILLTFACYWQSWWETTNQSWNTVSARNLNSFILQS